MLGGCGFSLRTPGVGGDSGIDDPDADATTDAATDAAIDTAIDAPIDATTTADAPMDVAMAGCPTGYTVNATTGSAYRFALAQVDWFAAEALCEADGPGAHLVVINQPTEQVVVDGFVPDDTPTWIGLTDRVLEGSWQWITPTTFVPNGWSPGQPNQNGVSDFDCADWLDSGSPDIGWRDERCNPTKAYLCECDGVAPDPTRW